MMEDAMEIETEEAIKLRLELQQAKDEIERLSQQLEEDHQGSTNKVFEEEATAGSTNNDEESQYSSESSDQDDSDEEDESDDEEDDEESLREPLSPDDEDIRLRAARTLIWANSALQRSSLSPRESGCHVVPDTVHILESASSVASPSSRFEDDAGSIFSTESKRMGPIASIRHFVSEAVEDVKETVADMKDLVAEVRTPEPELPVTSPSFKFCNAAFKKLGDDHSSHLDGSVASADLSSCTSPQSAKKHAPAMNAAMMKLAEKQKGKGLMTRFFGS